jgi:probable DNA repair protein
MDLSAALPSEIQQALDRGATVLTANQRAARTLRRAFDLDQRASGRAHWQPPSILAWDTWLASLWHRLLLEGHAAELLLNSTQEHTLWRTIIAADSATNSLRPVDSLATTAADAWLLLHNFRARNRLANVPGNSDTRVLARWAAEFERRCIRAQYLPQAQLPDRLRAAIAAGQLTLPPTLLLVGFDSTTPAQDALLDAAGAIGTKIDDLPANLPAPSLTLVDAPGEFDELTACARWLRTHLTERPVSRIAVIVPAIEDFRTEIDRVFRHILAPELNDVAAPTNSGPFEFSLGVPLAATPMVATALDLLRWATAPLSLNRVSALLLSPHFAAADASERLPRAEFDAFVLCDQHLLQPQVSIEALYELASARMSASLPILRDHLRSLRFFDRRDLATAERTHADWTAVIHYLLEAAGWAIPAHLDSVEFQTRRKWETALDELATLDFDSARVSFADALAALERITAETLFAPESRHAPIQIMGPLESAGSTFDAVWFLRANDSAWPAPSAPNPLLPWQLQRDLAMPGANPTLDAAHARRITQRIAASAPTVLFSYAHESAEGRQRSSPGLAGLTLEHHSALEIAPAENAAPRIELAILEDTDAIPAPPETALRGGASILQAQAACAFRAFAEKRLFSSAPESIELGLDARERGSLIHKVLELFWSEVQTQDRLRQMLRADRDSLLKRSIDAALTQQNRTVDPGWPQAYFAAERRRLFRLLSDWLDFELTRPPFAVKATEEQLPNVPIGPLHLDVRVDRVDTSLLNGAPAGNIILDYKTGSVNPAEWLGDRPDEPQLPLYAVVSQPAEIAAVAFAIVRPGKDQELKGYESRRDVLPRSTKLKTDSLDAQIDKWRQVLTNLAENFHAGDANVAPKQYPSTCRYCKQRLLCRLDLAALDANANEDYVDESDPAVDTLEPAAEVERA